MKNLFCVLLIILFYNNVSAQHAYYFGAGYNASVLHSDGLDYVIDRYNETRTYLDDEMEYCRYYDGITTHVGGTASAFAWDFGFTQRASTVSASGEDVTGTIQQRDLKSKWNTWDIGLGVCLGAEDNFALMIGINTGIDSEKQLTRADSPENINTANFEKVNSQYKVGFEPFVQFIAATDNGFGIMFKPYFSWTPVTTDYYELNSYINPYTYANDPMTIEGRLTGFGISLSLLYYEMND